MALTWWDMARRGRAESWRRIRELRSRPPVSVERSRRTLFSAALEQAQQQFEAAEGIAVESRAINLFYGLSQAGRALACALASAGEPHELVGHGIKVEQLNSASVTSLPSLHVRADGGSSASFRRLSALLRSDPLEKPVSLGSVWAMIVETELHLQRLDQAAVPALLVTASGDEPAEKPCLVTFPRRVVPDGFDQRELGAKYTSLKGATLHREAGASVNAAGEEFTNYELRLPLGIRHLPTYRGSPTILPAARELGTELHPMMIWWTVLYVLSMLTRYRPATWTDLVNVDRSPFAVPRSLTRSSGHGQCGDHAASMVAV